MKTKLMTMFLGYFMRFSINDLIAYLIYFGRADQTKQLQFLIDHLASFAFGFCL